MKRLLNSSKFWALILDTVISSVLFFVGKYAVPELAEDIKFVIMALQPVFLVLIAAIAAEDVAVKRNR
jgi:hypothetical protein